MPKKKHTPLTKNYAEIIYDLFYVPFRMVGDEAFHECKMRKLFIDRNMAEKMRVNKIFHLQDVLLNEGINAIISQQDVPDIDNKPCVLLRCSIKIDNAAITVLNRLNNERIRQDGTIR